MNIEYRILNEHYNGLWQRAIWQLFNATRLTLDGMQPTLRQVPPRAPLRSTHICRQELLVLHDGASLPNHICGVVRCNKGIPRDHLSRPCQQLTRQLIRPNPSKSPLWMQKNGQDAAWLEPATCTHGPTRPGAKKGEQELEEADRLHAELRSLDGRHISSRTAADDDKISLCRDTSTIRQGSPIQTSMASHVLRCD